MRRAMANELVGIGLVIVGGLLVALPRQFHLRRGLRLMAMGLGFGLVAGGLWLIFLI